MYQINVFLYFERNHTSTYQSFPLHILTTTPPTLYHPQHQRSFLQQLWFSLDQQDHEEILNRRFLYCCTEWYKLATRSTEYNIPVVESVGAVVVVNEEFAAASVSPPTNRSAVAKTKSLTENHISLFIPKLAFCRLFCVLKKWVW